MIWPLANINTRLVGAKFGMATRGQLCRLRILGLFPYQRIIGEIPEELDEMTRAAAPVHRFRND